MTQAYDALCRGEKPRFRPPRPLRDYLAWLAEQPLESTPGECLGYSNTNTLLLGLILAGGLLLLWVSWKLWRELEAMRKGEDDMEVTRLQQLLFSGLQPALPRLRLRGLMCLPAIREGFEAQREPFARRRELAEYLSANGIELDTLSMGMTDDHRAAIFEGATIVRIGTAIFGPRQ